MTRQKLFGLLGAVMVAAMTVACSQSDPGITTAVKSKLAADDTVKAYRIDVDTKDRVVTLKGDVDSEVGRQKAVEIARATEGVRDVVDALRVSPGATPTTGTGEPAQRRPSEPDRDKGGNLTGDPGLTAAIKTKMLADPTVAGLKIDVDTTDGVVTLHGSVTSAAEKKRALEIAKETEGVKSVKDDLKIAKK